MSETILICGASGLIGRPLKKALEAKGYNIKSLTSSKPNSDPSSGIYYWDIPSSYIEKEAFDGVSSIIYLSGAPISKRWTKSHKKRIIESRSGGLDLIRSTIERWGLSVKRLISSSAIGIYPHSPEFEYRESDRLSPKGFFEESIGLWEESIFRFKGVVDHVCAIRTAVVLDRRGGALPRMTEAVKLFVGAPFGSGQQWMPWVSLNDLVRLYIFALENSLNGRYNANVANVRNIDLMKELGAIYNRPIWSLGIPKFILRMLLGASGVLPYISTNVSSEKIRSVGFEFEDTDLSKLLENQRA